MKKITITFAVLIIISVLIPYNTEAQVPEKMSYQAVIRNSTNNLVQNQQIGMLITILQGSTTGIPVYVETQKPTTNYNGLATIEIGEGTVESGNFSNIDWAYGIYFIKTETDITGGTNYTITTISQLLSVPFALFAKTADYNSLSNKPPLFDGQYSSLTGTPALSTVALSGSYNDLLNRPALFNGSWTSLTNKPTTVVGYGITDFDFTGAAANDLLRFNGTQWVRFTPNFALATHVHANVTTTVSGFMSSADKTKLNGIDGSETEINAGKNITVTGTGTTASPYVVNVNIPHYIGELYGGGVIFYLDDDGEHGLICGMYDLAKLYWSNIGIEIGGSAQSYSDGQGNTTAIVGQAGHTAPSAASICNGYTNVNYGTGLYSDWYLPSIDELSLLFNARYHVSKTLDSDGSLSTYPPTKVKYWSSTEQESASNGAWNLDFGSGIMSLNAKGDPYLVRPVRDF